MAFTFIKGKFTAPTGAANQTTTITLAAGSAPKAIILFTAGSTADVLDAADTQFYYGCATYDASTAQQWFTAQRTTNGAGTMDSNHGFNTDAALKTYQAFSLNTTATIDSICVLTSMADTSVVLTWTDAPATAIEVHYVIIGGSDVTAARAGTFTTTTTATQNVTVVSSWGQPDLIHFVVSRTAAVTSAANNSSGCSMGWGKSDSIHAVAATSYADGVTTSQLAADTQARVMIGYATSGTALDAVGDLSARASWPTDGFQVAWPDQTATNVVVGYLALKGTFKSAVGTGFTLTAGSTQDLTHDASVPPSGVITMSDLNPAALASHVISDATNLGGFVVGASDFTNEGGIGWTEYDSDTTALDSRHQQSTKAIYTLQPVASATAATARGQADASASGNNVRLTYSALDNTAKRYAWVTFGPASAVAAVVAPRKSIVKRQAVNRAATH